VRADLRDDRGAVAVLVALLTVALVGVAAFTTDFGTAYVTKRNLQKAADAAALAAAGRIIALEPSTYSCGQIVADWTADTRGLRTAATATADSIASANSLETTRTAPIGVVCSADGKRVEVTYSNSGTNPTVLGGIFGVSATSSQRTATADIFAATSGKGLRPYAICTTDLQSLVTAASTAQRWVRVQFPNPVCGNYNGSWYTLNCPGVTNGSNAQTASDTATGCQLEVGIIDQSSAAASNAAIVDECTAMATNGASPRTPQDCLAANTGNISGTAAQNWAPLVDLPSITMPVFDPAWNDYATANVPSNKCKSGGSNGCYPVKAIVGAKVCGYNWGGSFHNITTTSSDLAPGGPCAGLTAAAVNAGGGSVNYLWLSLVSVQLEGSSGPGSIGVGGGSASGTRLVR
jgi:hypothetical protein